MQEFAQFAVEKFGCLPNGLIGETYKMRITISRPVTSPMFSGSKGVSLDLLHLAYRVEIKLRFIH